MDDIIDLDTLPANLRHLATNVQIVDLGPERFGHYDHEEDTLQVSKLGIEKKGFLTVLSHELAHKFCNVQSEARSNRFMREYAIMFIPYTYYMLKRRYSKGWHQRRILLEMFAHSLSSYVMDRASMSKGSLDYFSKWFPLSDNHRR